MLEVVRVLWAKAARALRQRVSLADLIRPAPAQTTETGRIGDPGKPLTPAMAPGSDPRAWQARTGRNLVTRPRGEPGKNLTAFEQLRTLAESCPLVQVAIRDVRDQILGMEWNVRPKPESKIDPATENTPEGQRRKAEIEDRIAQVRTWLKKPDPLANLRMREWLSPVIEEVLVTDALSLLPRFDRGRRFIGLEQVDGATILPLVDVRGRPPRPPLPAYQQIIDGVPETEFTIGPGAMDPGGQLKQLWYLPRNRRPDGPYGRSPVEMVLITINLAIRRELFKLAYYASGSVPDTWIMAPQSWTPEQIKGFQVWVDEVLAGDIERRAGGAVVVPGGGTIQEARSEKWSYEYEEWLGRVIAWAFGVSSMPIAKQMNRSTSETMEQSSMESGPRPVAAFIAESVFARVVEEFFGFDDIEIAIGDDETEDPDIAYQRAVAFVNARIFLPNEVREDYGRAPIEGGDEFPAPSPSPFGAFGRDGEDDDPPPSDQREEMEEDLARWQRLAVKRQRDGKKPKRFISAAIPAPLCARIQAGIEKAASADEIRRAFALPLAIRKSVASTSQRARSLPSAGSTAACAAS